MTTTTSLRVMAHPNSGAADNPYTLLLNDALRREGVEVVPFSRRELFRDPPDVLHVHWPEAGIWRSSGPLGTGQNLWRSIRFRTAVSFLRARGVAAIWTVHNLEPHSGPSRAGRRLYRWMARHVDGFIALSDAARAKARATYPALSAVPSAVVPHGHYRDHYPNEISRSAARTQIGLPLDAPVILHVGALRRYKGIHELITAFRELEHPDAWLAIAGALGDGITAEELMGLARNHPQIRFDFGRIADDDVQVWFGAADLVVLPYRRVLQSGTAMLALSFNRPVLVPDDGPLRELQEELGDAWVRTFERPLGGEDLEDALVWANSPRPEEAPLDHLRWNDIARLTIEAYEDALVSQ